jgi:predicted negative regulator of RcsB-dependent stress response
MGKLKLAILAILVVVLVDFALENGQAVPVLTLFKHPLVTVPTYLLAYICLAVGLVIGWSMFALRARRKRRDQAAQAAQAAPAASAQQGQEPQANQAGDQAQ